MELFLVVEAGGLVSVVAGLASWAKAANEVASTSAVTRFFMGFWTPDVFRVRGLTRPVANIRSMRCATKKQDADRLPGGRPWGTDDGRNDFTGAPSLLGASANAPKTRRPTVSRQAPWTSTEVRNYFAGAAASFAAGAFASFAAGAAAFAGFAAFLSDLAAGAALASAAGALSAAGAWAKAANDVARTSAEMRFFIEIGSSC